jgi:hypothetical protein
MENMYSMHLLLLDEHKQFRFHYCALTPQAKQVKQYLHPFMKQKGFEYQLCKALAMDALQVKQLNNPGWQKAMQFAHYQRNATLLGFTPCHFELGMYLNFGFNLQQAGMFKGMRYSNIYPEICRMRDVYGLKNNQEIERLHSTLQFQDAQISNKFCIP